MGRSLANKKIQNIIRWILFLNLLVLVIKLFIGFSTRSLSILGDAVHSGVDSLNNIIGLSLVSIASMPPDEDHPYGHSKFETLGALGIVAFLAVASFELIEKSILRFINPAELPILDTTALVMLTLTLIINIFVWLYEKNAGKKYDSQFLLADAEHTFSDVLITLSILASCYFIMQGYYILDPILGIVIALVIIKSGWEILKRTVPILVDEAWLKPQEVRELVLSFDKAVSCEDIKSRKGPLKNFLELSIKFDTDSLSEAHEISHSIEEEIKSKFLIGNNDAEITIHIEPKECSHPESHQIKIPGEAP